MKRFNLFLSAEWQNTPNSMQNLSIPNKELIWVEIDSQLFWNIRASYVFS